MGLNMFFLNRLSTEIFDLNVIDIELLTVDYSLSNTQFGLWDLTSDSLSLDSTSATPIMASLPSKPLYATVNGTSGDDNLTGTAAPDTINGLDGDDVIDGGGGADTINGGDGDDYMILMWNEGSDDFFGGSGSDTLDLSDSDFTSGLNVDLDAGTYQFGTASSIENVRGTQNGDTITGSSAVNDIRGNDGNDTINTLGGNDTIYDGNGDDVVNGGTGNDTFIIGLGNDTLNGDAGNDLFDLTAAGFDLASVTDINGGTGTDSFQFGTFNSDYNVNLITGEMTRISTGQTFVMLTSIENITAGNGDDILIGASGTNTLIGGGGDDIMQGGSNLFGGAGNDTFLYFDGTGFDNFDGGTGLDTIDFSGDTGSLYINLGTESYGTSSGTATFDIISVENVIGSVDDNEIIGSNSDNIIDGGDGGDILDGAGGTDTLSYSRSNAAVSVDLGSNIAVGGHADGDTISSFENLIGSDFGDQLEGTAGANVIDGGDGNDTINGDSGNDTLNGDDGNDTINSGNGNDIMNGGAGDDLLEGSNGVNVYNGDAGDDTLQILGFTAGNTFDGGADNDTFSFATFSNDYIANLTTGVYDRVATGQASTLANIENITAGNGDDILTGDAGANIINAGGGIDVVNQTGGADVVDLGFGNDTLNITSFYTVSGVSYEGGTGSDTVDASTLVAGVNPWIFDLNNNEYSFVGSGISASLTNFENVEGSLGADQITGNATNNTLNGNIGDDVIAGLGGADTMDGGDGIDTLDYSASNSGVTINLITDTASGGHAAGDIISNFENVIGSNSNDTITIDANSTANIINAGGGNDIIQRDGSTGGTIDTIDGGTGINTLITTGLGGSHTIDLLGGEILFGASSRDQLMNIQNVTVNSAASVTGNGDNNVIIGIGSFNNEFEGGEGDDTMDGGAGTDYAVYSTSALSDFDISNSAGVYTVTSAATGTDTLTNFEFIQISGTNYALTGGFAFTENNDIGDGTLGGDIIFALGGNDIVNGLGGNDLIYGDLGADTLNGGDGNDVLNGGGGGDTLDGGAGFDTADYTGSTNRVDVSLLANNASGAQATGDTLISIENLTGSNFGDDLRGDNGVNIVKGGGGRDTLIGYNGDDELYGGDNRDILNGGDGADILDGGGDVDQARYNGSSSAVQINLLDGTATGGQATGDTLISIENLFGSNHGDTLYGDGNNNKIFGHNGDDFLAGNGGISKLYGGSGSDSFVLSDGFAFVMDFADDVDMLDVSDYGFATLADALENVDQVGAHARFRFDGDVLLVLNTDMNDLMDDIVI